MAFVRVDLENYDVVPSGIGVFQQAMESEPSSRCPESHVSTDTPSDQQYLSQKDGHDDDLFSKGLPCTGKDISDAGLEGFGNTPTSVDDANWMPIAPFPSSMLALSLPPNESYDAKMCISEMPNGEAKGHL